MARSNHFQNWKVNDAGVLKRIGIQEQSIVFADDPITKRKRKRVFYLWLCTRAAQNGFTRNEKE